MPEIDSRSVAAWMRNRAAKFIEMAEALEATFLLPFEEQAELVMALIAESDVHWQLADIARKLHLNPECVRRIIVANPFLEMNERGWVHKLELREVESPEREAESSNPEP